MIGISSCTEQEVATVKDSGAQIELRTSGPCGDAPNSNNGSVSIVSTRRGPHGVCCVTIEVNIPILPGFILGTAQYFEGPDGSYYTSPNPNPFPLPTTPVLPITQSQSFLTPLQTVYEVCFTFESATKYLNISIKDANGIAISCDSFINPCI